MNRLFTLQIEKNNRRRMAMALQPIINKTVETIVILCSVWEVQQNRNKSTYTNSSV